MVFLLVLALVLVGCASAPAPVAAAPPDQPIAERNALAAQQQAQTSAQTQALVAAADQQRRQAEQSFTDQQATQMQALQQAAEQAQLKRAEDARQVRELCAGSRPTRVGHARTMVAARIDAETRLLKHSKAIQSVCRLGTRRTGAVTVRGSGRGGWRVAPELAEDLACGALPSGITKDDAYVVLSRVRDGSLKPTGPILDSEDRSPEDDACESLDREAGVDFRSVLFEDSASLERLLRWKPAPPSP